MPDSRFLPLVILKALLTTTPTFSAFEVFAVSRSADMYCSLYMHAEAGVGDGTLYRSNIAVLLMDFVGITGT